MVQTRRSFLTTAAATAAAASVPRVARANSSFIHIPAGARWSDPDLHALAADAVSAARSAGAAYADARLTYDRMQGISGELQPREDDTTYGVGVRVLVNGYWGYMGSAVWTSDEMARLARGAVSQAKANAVGGTRETDLGPVPPVVLGEWRTPVKYDPFEIPKGERIDLLREMMLASTRYDPHAHMFGAMTFRRQLKVFASSDGSRYAQTTYLTAGDVSISYDGQYSLQVGMASMNDPMFTPAAKGWEYFSESSYFERLPELIERAAEMRFVTSVEIDRYDAVLSAQAVAALLDPSIGAATELDRAMGFEANAGGTSYLNKPLDMVGTTQLGAPMLNVTADRSTLGGLSTVQWDDEGIVPEPFPIVTDGMLVDFQTTREQAAWLAPYYQKRNLAVRSHGCAGAQSALFITTQRSPNLHMQPGASDVTFDDLVNDTKRGVAVMGVNVQIDHQQLTGVGHSIMREIKDGKLGRYLPNAGFLFRSPELWKSLVSIGGPSTSEWFGFGRTRGQPIQTSFHSVGAVPAKFSNLAVIDVTRKA